MAVPEGTAKFREETSKKQESGEPPCCEPEDRVPLIRLQASFCIAAFPAVTVRLG